MTRRDQIIDAARRCFADRGYGATSIRDLEEAAGLTPGAGGLYRHVPSKQALLEAVVRAEVDANRRAVEAMHAPTDDDPRRLLEHGARAGLAQLDDQVELMRILFRDLPAFPDLVELVRRELTDEVYRAFADRVRTGQAVGVVPTAVDADAVAVLAIGPLVDVKLKQHLLGFTPLDVDEDRLVAAWVDLFAGHLGGDAGGDPGGVR